MSRKPWRLVPWLRLPPEPPRSNTQASISKAYRCIRSRVAALSRCPMIRAGRSGAKGLRGIENGALCIRARVQPSARKNILVWLLSGRLLILTMEFSGLHAGAWTLLARRALRFLSSVKISTCCLLLRASKSKQRNLLRYVEIRWSCRHIRHQRYLHSSPTSWVYHAHLLDFRPSHLRSIQEPADSLVIA